MNRKVVENLMKAGVRPDMDGFRFLCDCITYVIDNNNIMPPMGDLVKLIAKNYKFSEVKVRKDLDKAVKSTHTPMDLSEYISYMAYDVVTGGLFDNAEL